MSKVDFKLVRRGDTANRIKKENVQFSSDGHYLILKIPISTIPPANNENLAIDYRSIKSDNSPISLVNTDIYLESNVGKVLKAGKWQEDTSTTKLTAVVEFDTKKPVDEPI